MAALAFYAANDANEGIPMTGTRVVTIITMGPKVKEVSNNDMTPRTDSVDSF